MNADSPEPRRSEVAAPSSIRAYWRRLPYFSCSSWTTGVKTRDPKLWAITALLRCGTHASDSASALRQPAVQLTTQHSLGAMQPGFHRFFAQLQPFASLERRHIVDQAS